MNAPQPTAIPAAGAAARAPRWLLLVHQLPPEPSNLRVRTWRRLQQIGALAVKQAVYALPDSPTTREDFEWLKSEIQAAGGEATIFVADTVDTWTNDALIEEFRRSREEAYNELARDTETVRRRLETTRRRTRPPSRRITQQLRARLTALERIDFFGSAGRDRVLTLLQQVEARANPKPGIDRKGSSSDAPASFHNRLWVTRPRPGVDRMSSAWLIRQFIDPNARFDFAADREHVPPDALPFDMFGVEFTHRGDLCTFEMLCETFHLEDPALTKIAAVVHDLDLKDGRFGATEAPAIDLVIEGLRLAFRGDQELLREGMTLFDALYRSFSQAARSSGPRPVAKRRQSARTRSKMQAK